MFRGLRRRVPDDHYRAARVIDTMLADRAEQPPDEIPVTVTADDEQLSVAGCVHEYMAGPPWGHQTGHMGALVGSEGLLDGGLKLKAGIRLVVP